MIETGRQCAGFYLNRIKENKGKTFKEVLLTEFKHFYKNRTEKHVKSDLDDFANNIETDQFTTHTDGIWGAVELIKHYYPENKYLNTPQAMVNCICFIRVRNILNYFFEAKPYYNLDSKIDNQLIEDFTNYYNFAKTNSTLNYRIYVKRYRESLYM